MELLKKLEEVFAYRLKELRGDLIQPAMAERLGVSNATYQRWESGKHFPKEETRALISKNLNISETILFLDPDHTKPTDEQVLARINEVFNRQSSGNNVELNELFDRLKPIDRAHYLAVLRKAVP